MMPDDIRAHARNADSYSAEHKCKRIHLMQTRESIDLMERLAALAGVELRFTKGEPKYRANLPESSWHIIARTTFGWFHLHGTDRRDDPDSTLLLSLLSALCNGYWVSY
jgi:hypothetical protein